MENGEARMAYGRGFLEFNQEAIRLIFGNEPSDPKGCYLGMFVKRDGEGLVLVGPCRKKAACAVKAAGADMIPRRIRLSMEVLERGIPWLAGKMESGEGKAVVLQDDSGSISGCIARVEFPAEEGERR